MKTYRLHQRVMDRYTGRVGHIVKVIPENGLLVYRVKFCSYTEDYHSDELREPK